MFVVVVKNGEPRDTHWDSKRSESTDVFGLALLWHYDRRCDQTRRRYNRDQARPERFCLFLGSTTAQGLQGCWPSGTSKRPFRPTKSSIHERRPKRERPHR